MLGIFAFVHAGFLGDAAHAEVGDYEVDVFPDCLVAKDIPVWQPDPDGTGRAAEVRYTFHVARPLTASFMKVNGENRFAMFASVTPVAECESLSWLTVTMSRRKSFAGFRMW
jgi:hypothetical protein